MCDSNKVYSFLSTYTVELIDTVKIKSLRLNRFIILNMNYLGILVESNAKIIFDCCKLLIGKFNFTIWEQVNLIVF